MTRAELFGTLVPDGRMLAGRPADQPDDAEGSAEQPEYAERDAGEPLHRDLLTHPALGRPAQELPPRRDPAQYVFDRPHQSERRVDMTGRQTTEVEREHQAKTTEHATDEKQEQAHPGCVEQGG